MRSIAMSARIRRRGGALAVMAVLLAVGSMAVAQIRLENAPLGGLQLDIEPEAPRCMSTVLMRVS
jgi:hypothetical protein